MEVVKIWALLHDRVILTAKYTLVLFMCVFFVIVKHLRCFKL